MARREKGRNTGDANVARVGALGARGDSARMVGSSLLARARCFFDFRKLSLQVLCSRDGSVSSGGRRSRWKLRLCLVTAERLRACCTLRISEVGVTTEGIFAEKAKGQKRTSGTLGSQSAS